MKERSGFRCEGCKSLYWDYNKAVNCCPMVRDVWVWLCDTCNQDYEDEAEAEACCTPTVTPKEAS